MNTPDELDRLLNELDPRPVLDRLLAELRPSIDELLDELANAPDPLDDLLKSLVTQCPIRASEKGPDMNAARAAGLPAKRAYGSNGRALGCAETVDLLISGLRIQAKRRKCIAGYVNPPAGADAVAIREDRGETLVVLPLPLLLRLLKRTASRGNPLLCTGRPGCLSGGRPGMNR